MLRVTGVVGLWVAAFATGGLLVGGLATPAAAQEVRLTEERAEVEVVLNGAPVVIRRNPDATAVLAGDFAKTSRACPPFCIQPIQAGAGLQTLGELELIAFLETKVAEGKGVLIDSRLPEWFGKGALPGAVNVPFATLAPNNPFQDDILRALGGILLADGTFDFEGALDLALYCNGPWSDQAPRAIRYLVEAGYPAEKLHYYRGGMQDWLMLGLTVVAPPVQG